MTYAKIIDNTITDLGRLPRSARRLDTAQWVMGLADAPVELQRATGWVEVADTPRPDDTDTHTHDRSVELVKGVPTVVWVERAWTETEVEARERAANWIDPDERLDVLERLLDAKEVVTRDELDAERARTPDVRAAR